MATAIPFTPHADEAVLSRIRRQLAEYRWPHVPPGLGWSCGAEAETVRHLADRWLNHFDWRAEEARLNQREHFKAEAAGTVLHGVHVRAARASDRAPLVLVHGWPGSFLEYLEVADRVAGADDGGRDVVVVSLPGTGYSDTPEQPMGPRAVARSVHALMTEVLGHARYVAHGADWGSIVSAWLGFDQPAHCAGVHMTMVSPRFVAGLVKEPEEQAWLAGFRERFEDDGAYFRLQTTRPATAGFLLADNPVGLLAWMLEKFAAWSDPAQGDPSALFRTPELADRLLRNVMLYLVTGTAASSIWIYRALTAEGPPGYPGGQRVNVPVAFAATRDPMFVPPPRGLVEKAYNVVRWTALPRGGHFPGLEVPELLADDIAAFANGL
ncbi:epoxide hydrolase family protein [Hydrogenophaga sp. T2]|uniref:epoxide hydrolase family protein n=1 Tax=Hydrogenophaga sp. T2 TaxID=3132823 RepID=UPI003CF56234